MYVVRDNVRIHKEGKIGNILFTRIVHNCKNSYRKYIHYYILFNVNSPKVL